MSLASLTYDAECDQYLLGDQPLERGDYIDLLVYDQWCRVRIDYSEQFKGWYGLARQTTDPDHGDHPLTILLRPDLLVRGAPGRWSQHHGDDAATRR